ncbi:MAG: CpaF family protein [Acidimicrobiia bacterium]|nr:Flp pilus assembly complex ATPase component TadA [Acidimicrobiia bacterium]MBT8217160.1 Flp pilus assembly complex ATPase component TadA [Acidimicrobiia bacterium]NNF11158.1 CpaF family protein [Acidimicrobiia bacterium]NNL69338.1 CpaF family protein [Acidimicrobiia bacterium]
MTTTAYEQIRQAAVSTVEDLRLDPARDYEEVRRVVSTAVDDYQRRAHLGHGRALADVGHMVDRVVSAITDYGPFTDLFARSDIEEIFIEGSRVSYIDGSGRLKGVTEPTTEEENRHIVNRLLGETDRHLDTANPIVQARVLDGSARLTAVIPPVADTLSATIRRYALRRQTLAGLVDLGSLTPGAAGFLWALMQTNASTLLSGPPGAGKTSLLSALVAAAPPNHCIRAVEEVRELFVPIVHGSYYEARPPSLDRSGEIALRDLVKVVMAMRPDRIVVGEVRGAEAFELTRAANAGCGFACTVHANSARDALNAIVNAAMMAGENVAEPVVRKVFSTTIDVVIHLDRDAVPRQGATGLRRQVTEILAVVPAMGEDFTTEPLFVRPGLGEPLQWTGAVPPSATVTMIERTLPDDMSLREILEGRRLPPL